MSVTDTVLDAIRNGHNKAAGIAEATGLEKSQVWNALHRLRESSAIKTVGRGPAATIVLLSRAEPPTPRLVRAPAEAPDDDFRALITHRSEVQVTQGAAVCNLKPSQALDLYRFLSSMEPILVAAVEESDA